MEKVKQRTRNKTTESRQAAMEETPFSPLSFSLFPNSYCWLRLLSGQWTYVKSKKSQKIFILFEKIRLCLSKGALNLQSFRFFQLKTKKTSKLSTNWYDLTFFFPLQYSHTSKQTCQNRIVHSKMNLQSKQESLQDEKWAAYFLLPLHNNHTLATHCLIVHECAHSTVCQVWYWGTEGRNTSRCLFNCHDLLTCQFSDRVCEKKILFLTRVRSEWEHCSCSLDLSSH